MKKFMIFTAVVMILIISGMAHANVFTSTMSGSNWSLYDQDSPFTMSSSGDTYYDKNYSPFSSEAIAFKVDFSSITLSNPIGTFPSFSLCLQPADQQYSSGRVQFNWFSPNQFNFEGQTYNVAGYFYQYPRDTYHVDSLVETPGMTSGSMGILYDGVRTVYVGYELGGVWYTLATPDVGPNWGATQGLYFQLHVSGHGGSISLNIDDVMSTYPALNSVPEPATMLLLGLGLMGLAGVRRKFKK